MSGVTMVERVEAAMRAKRLELIAMPLDRAWPEVARAAIEAMRPPLSDDMIESSAGLRVAGCYDDMRVTDAILSSVIDAALAEGEKG